MPAILSADRSNSSRSQKWIQNNISWIAGIKENFSDNFSRKLCRRLLLSLPILAVDDPDILRIVLHFIEGIIMRIFYRKENVIVTRDVFLPGKYPELVFPDKMVDGVKSGRVYPAQHVPEPVPARKEVDTP